MKKRKLMTVGPFERYVPENGIGGVSYLQDADGRDWYALQAAFSPDTLKIMIDAGDVVVSMTDNVSGFAPLGLRVAEVEKETVPAGVSINGEWQFDGKRIVPRRYTEQEQRQQMDDEKRRRLDLAGRRIAPLQDAVDLGMATPQEQQSLDGWKRYRVALNRLTFDANQDSGWPTPPDDNPPAGK